MTALTRPLDTYPVCGYSEAGWQAKFCAICPKCMTQFGYDDATTSHEELRRRWLRELHEEER